MARFRVFDTETANLMIPRISPDDTVDINNAGEYFSADAGEVILAPSVRNGEVLYIKIRTAASAPTPSRPETEPESQPHAPLETAADIAHAPAVASSPSEPRRKHYVATGFLGLDGDVEEEDTPEPPKPWWKRLID